jgi:hypothetical protein
MTRNARRDFNIPERVRVYERSIVLESSRDVDFGDKAARLGIILS